MISDGDWCVMGGTVDLEHDQLPEGEGGEGRGEGGMHGVVCEPGLVSTMPGAVSAGGGGQGEPHTPSPQLGLVCGTYVGIGEVGLVPDSSLWYLVILSTRSLGGLLATLSYTCSNGTAYTSHRGLTGGYLLRATGNVMPSVHGLHPLVNFPVGNLVTTTMGLDGFFKSPH